MCSRAWHGFRSVDENNTVVGSSITAPKTYVAAKRPHANGKREAVL
jgi:hypothetical protein